MIWSPLAVDVTVGQIATLAVALGVGGFAREIYAGFRDRKKMDAGTAKTLTEATVILLAPLHTRLEQEQVDHALCRQERGRLERENRQLVADNFTLRQRLDACEERPSSPPPSSPAP